jgi:CRISPR-associated endonuclease/helicase Cas3
MSVLRIHATPDGRRLAYGGVLARMKRDLREWFGQNVDDAEDRKVLAAAKALTIAADVCASAIRGRFHRQSNDRFIAEFTGNLLDEGLTEDELRKIIAKWAYDVTPGEKPPKNWNKKSLPKSFRFRPFQEEVANSPSKITLAQAGCGSGKSIASYLWAQRLLKDYGQKKLRMIFTLPTTGTSTEHYRDYALESGLDGRLTALSHSRAVVDLAYDEKGAEAMLEHRARIESLELWGTQITICTVDTVLGLMANQRKAIYSFPAIMKSAIVFDEIHAYDDVMFGHLLVFIKNFTGIPMLLMTASLPEERLEAIRDVRPDLHVVHGDRSYEEAKRYAKFELTRPVSDGKMHIVEDRIREYIDLYPNAKILWVRNQVKWANETYQACLRLFGDIADVDLYHSRYRYKDRTRIHSRVIQRFKTSPRPSILVATQVAEMSLNLSAHLLVTDVCEIPGVIQRMGRCNRGASPLPAPAGHTIVCCLPSYDKNKMNCYPYKEQQVNDCVRWAQELQHVGPLSQKDLADAFERYRAPAAVNLQDAECNAVFFKQTWETTIGAARDPNPTVTILLENDYDAFIASGEAGGRQDRIRMWLREHETNVVSRAAVNGWRRYKGVPVAPSNEIIYGEIDDPQPERRTGAEWAV